MLFRVGHQLAYSIAGTRRNDEMNAKLTTREKGGVTIVDIIGRLTHIDGSSALREKMCELVKAGSKRILINMADVTSIDSVGIGELVAGFTHVASAGGEMKLVNLGKRVQRILQVTKLSTAFKTYEDEDSAIWSFSKLQPAEASHRGSMRL
jgi:anti-sigma B factor antagonist